MRDSRNEEEELSVREILSQITEYVDDVSIHMTSHPVDAMVETRMSLARRGFDLLRETPRLLVYMHRDEVLEHKHAELLVRYSNLARRIAGDFVAIEEED